jgi:hypothetical protein
VRVRRVDAQKGQNQQQQLSLSSSTYEFARVKDACAFNSGFCAWTMPDEDPAAQQAAELEAWRAAAACADVSNPAALRQLLENLPCKKADKELNQQQVKIAEVSSARRTDQAFFLGAIFVVALGAFLGAKFLQVPTPKLGRHIGPQLYLVDTAALAAANLEAFRRPASLLATSYLPSSRDNTTDAFLAGCSAATDTWVGKANVYAREKLSDAAQRFLGWSRTDASSMFRRATLFVASEGQLRRVLTRASSHSVGGSTRHLLDIGAGKGEVTRMVAEVMVR